MWGEGGGRSHQKSGKEDDAPKDHPLSKKREEKAPKTLHQGKTVIKGQSSFKKEKPWRVRGRRRKEEGGKKEDVGRSLNPVIRPRVTD